MSERPDDRRQEQQQGGWAYGAGRFAEHSSDFIRWFDWGALLDPHRGPRGFAWWKWIVAFLILINLLVPWTFGFMVRLGLMARGWLP